jgi:hypothetical protein
VVIREPTFAVVRTVTSGVVIIRDGPERVKVIFVVRMEDSSIVIDRRIIKLCVALRQFLVSKFNVEHKVVL